VDYNSNPQFFFFFASQPFFFVIDFF